MTHHREECGAPVPVKWSPCPDCASKGAQETPRNSTPETEAVMLRRVIRRIRTWRDWGRP